MRRQLFAQLLCCVFLLAGGQNALAELDRAGFEADFKTICSFGPRVIGSEGYQRSVDYVRQQIASLPGVELRQQTFPVMVPVTLRADLALPDGTTARIYPFWPAGIRLNATPGEGITGKLIYIKDAHYQDIGPARLAGQIAVIEASARQDWTQAFYFGAKAVVVLGSPQTGNGDLQSHDMQIPVNFPRFYLPPSPLSDQLRHQGINDPATLHVQARWEEKTAVNLYALVKSPSLIPGWNELVPPGALLIGAPLESSGLVPDLAVGASQAVQTAAVLSLLRDAAAAPLKRPILFAFTGADSIQFLGSRHMYMALSDVPRKWRGELEKLASDEDAVQHDLQRALELNGDPRRLSVSADRSLIDRIVKIIETDAALEMDQLFRLRMLPGAQRKQPEISRQIDTLQSRQAALNTLRYLLQEKPSEISEQPSGTNGDDNFLADARVYLDRTIGRLGGGSNPNGLMQQYSRRHQMLDERIALYQWLARATSQNDDPEGRTNDSRILEMAISVDLSDGGARCGPMYWGQFQRFNALWTLQDYKDWFDKLERTYKADKQRKPAAAAPTTRGTAQTGDADEARRWYEEVWAPRKRCIDLDSLNNIQTMSSFLCASMPIETEMALSFGVPGFTFLTFDDLRPRRDTPTDTPDRIDLDRIWPQLDAVRALMWRAWNSPDFKGPREVPWKRNTFFGQVLSAAPGRPVPDLPRAGFLATYAYASMAKNPALATLPYVLGVRRDEVQTCDAEGNWRFEGMSQHPGSPGPGGSLARFVCLAYSVEDKTGQVTACSDVSKDTNELAPYAYLDEEQILVRNMVFNCEEFSLTGLYDPRFLQDLNSVQLLDARRNATPQRFGLMIQKQMLAGFIEPGMRSFLMFHYGSIGNRLVLINMAPPTPQEAQEEDPLNAALLAEAQKIESTGSAQDAVRLAGRGFTATELNNLRALAQVTSRDFERLDQIRLSRYAKANVRSELLDGLQSLSRGELAEARKASDSNDGPLFIRQANGAWADQARVYQVTKDMANDVIHGAIFLLLLCIPFSFCMERLLIATPNIYKQITAIAVIFAVMAVALWSFHPAFKISSNPLIIVLAFAIILMSMIVISVVYGKFDSEMKRMRSGRGTAQTASFASASVLMSAVLLGVANMRKRKFRTALTAITIILITFAVLCFTSASKYVDATVLPTGQPSSHAGIMLRQRGYRPMPTLAADNLRAVLGHRQIVERWWNINAGDPRESFHVVSHDEAPDGARVFPATAILGLSPGESKLAASGESIRDVMGSAYDRLENGETDIIFLSDPIAGKLQVKQGDFVRMGGMKLQVAAVFSADAFDRDVKILGGESLAPLRYEGGGLDASGKRLDNNSEEALDLDIESSASEAVGNYEHLSASQFVIVPAAIARALPDCSLRSLAFKVEINALNLNDLDASELHDAAFEEEIAGAGNMSKAAIIDALLAKDKNSGLKDPPALLNEIVGTLGELLSRRFSVALFAGYSDGVKMISSGAGLPQVSGAGTVAVPLVIAGLIIFNTMMGSIAERRREIHIYTSLGLAPVYVGALFVAEAMTYGLIGTVFGYIIGQGVGTLLTDMGLLSGVTLNYSGTSAIVTMSVILLIVLFSALAPARLASKIAAPSIERSWKVPAPVGDQISAQLPFTINKTAADGVVAYLAEFFEDNRDGSVGNFSSANVETFSFADEQQRDIRGLKTVVWLTPFDLGVRQHLMLVIHPGMYPEIYEVQVVLQRLSGEVSSWHRMNRTFLTELRKQFLQWRSLSPQRMLQYVEESKRRVNAAGA